MSNWRNINVEDYSRHPLRPKIFQVMQTVYRRLYPSKIPPSIDPWWYSPSLSYRVDQSNPLEPTVVILNLREGQPDCPAMDTRFTINLNTCSIHDKFKDYRSPAPLEILGILGDIKQFVRDSLKADRKRQDEYLRDRRRMKQDRLDARKTREKAFYDRLLENQCIEWDVEPSPAGYCSACFSDAGVETGANIPLVECITCKKVSCSNNDCEGHDIDDIERCSDHTGQAQCNACRNNKAKPQLTPCPDCKRWYCFSDLSRCVGRPLPIAPLPIKTEGSNSQLPAPKETSQQKNQSRPQHTLKTAPCRRCTTGIHGWNRCGTFSCWSGQDMVCNDCSPEGGLECSKGHIWICDTCSHKQLPLVWACPGCSELFCASCNASDRCFACGTSCLCVDCAKLNPDPDYEENQPPIDDSPDPEVVTIEHPKILCWECESCGGKLCHGCTTTGAAKSCNNCSSEICGECADTDQCVGCGAMMCQCCDEKECHGCFGFGRSKMEDLVYEMFEEY